MIIKFKLGSEEYKPFVFINGEWKEIDIDNDTFIIDLDTILGRTFLMEIIRQKRRKLKMKIRKGTFETNSKCLIFF